MSSFESPYSGRTRTGTPTPTSSWTNSTSRATVVREISFFPSSSARLAASAAFFASSSFGFARSIESFALLHQPAQAAGVGPRKYFVETSRVLRM